MRKKGLQMALVLTLPLALTACGLLPAEESVPVTPVIYDYERQEYEQTEVLRGDLIDSMTVRCKYVPAKEETLSFAMGGAFLDQVYVNLGEHVQAGQLLAELEHADLQSRITAQEQRINVLWMEKRHILEDKELALERCDILGDAEQRADVEQSYARPLQDKDDALYLQQLLLEELRTDLQQRQIYACMDGTVTYLREVEDGERSVKGKLFMKISDMQTTVFTVEGKGAEYFRVGETMNLVCQKKNYEATVVEAAELGLEETDEQIVYLKLKQPDPTLEEGVSGSVEVILAERRDVCYVEKKAIRTTGDQSFVYMLDEDGLRIMRDVTLGLVSGVYVEVVDGLEEGELVLVE